MHLLVIGGCIDCKRKFKKKEQKKQRHGRPDTAQRSTGPNRFMPMGGAGLTTGHLCWNDMTRLAPLVRPPEFFLAMNTSKHEHPIIYKVHKEPHGLYLLSHTLPEVLIILSNTPFFLQPHTIAKRTKGRQNWRKGNQIQTGTLEKKNTYIYI